MKERIAKYVLYDLTCTRPCVDNGDMGLYLADIDGCILLLICPVAQSQTQFLLAVLPTQLHLLLNTSTKNEPALTLSQLYNGCGLDGFKYHIYF